MKKYIFNPGPPKLPKYTLENTAKAVLELDNTGLSIMEVSHRSAEFKTILEDTQNLFKELLEVPDGYHVLFLGGGASLQFLMVPYNLLNRKAAYLNTGSWAKKAIKEAKLFGEVDIVASSEDKNFSYIPKEYVIPVDADYFHYTSNNTIKGTEILTDPDSPVPLVSDMSSDIMSRAVDVSKYAIIYGGCQKNIGPAGVAFIVVREDILGKVERDIPTMLDYKIHIEKASAFNTPPCLPIFAVRETLNWIKNQGGVKQMEKNAILKSSMLYDAIDNSKIFTGTVPPEDRSRMNVCFVMKDEYKDLEEKFLEYTKEKGIVGIKGHRSVGGFRASLYNAVEIEELKYLIEVMNEFERKFA